MRFFYSGRLILSLSLIYRPIKFFTTVEGVVVQCIKQPKIKLICVYELHTKILCSQVCIYRRPCIVDLLNVYLVISRKCNSTFKLGFHLQAGCSLARKTTWDSEMSLIKHVQILSVKGSISVALQISLSFPPPPTIYQECQLKSVKPVSEAVKC